MNLTAYVIIKFLVVNSKVLAIKSSETRDTNDGSYVGKSTLECGKIPTLACSMPIYCRDFST